MSNLQENFTELDLGHKTVKFRKWKVKDRKELRKIVQTNPNDIIKVMVLNCLEDKNIALSPEELQYIFIKMREASISDKFKFEYTCSCSHKNSYDMKISDVTKFTFSPFKEITSGDLTISLSNVKNPKFYNSKVIDPQYADIIDIIDFVLHIDSINGNIDKSFEELVNLFLEMDADIFDDIMEQYSEMTFKIDNTKEIVCGSCKKGFKFIFDEIPDFFPKSWILR